jgi:HlyD family secretion protein
VLYTVEVNAENPDGTLLPYLTANVSFLLHKETNTFLVANAALRWSPSSLAEISPAARSQGSFDPPPADAKPDKKSKEVSGIVWLKDGDYVRPLEVKVGTSDGAFTAVSAQDLQEGLEVVTSDAAEKTQVATLNPFQPRIIRR